MRVWVWAAAMALVTVGLVPGAAAEETCQGAVVVEHCAYEDEPVEDASGGYCDAYHCRDWNTTKSGDEVRVGDASVWIGEEHREEHGTQHTSRDERCAETYQNDHSSTTWSTRVEAGGASTGTYERSSEQTWESTSACPHATSNESAREEHEDKGMWVEHGLASASAHADQWTFERDRAHSRHGNESESSCGLFLGLQFHVHGVTRQGHYADPGQCLGA